jgi:hypothetical protein
MTGIDLHSPLSSDSYSRSAKIKGLGRRPFAMERWVSRPVSERLQGGNRREVETVWQARLSGIGWLASEASEAGRRFDVLVGSGDGGRFRMATMRGGEAP